MGRRVAAQRVGDEPTGKTPLLLQQLSKEPDRRSSIPSRLDEDVQHVAILIHGSPQVLFPAIDRHEELVEMPRVAQPAAPAPERAGIAQAERGQLADRNPRRPPVTTSILIQPETRTVIVGVDTHKHVHVAVAINTRGIRLGDQSFVADSGGYRALITWADTHGRIKAFGIEGTGSYGAGLARAVRRAGHRVVEVNRGDRHTRRAVGKSDTVDAESAARSVLAGQATATPKTGDGVVEMIRQLKIARDTAGKARTAAMVTLKQIVVNAPPHLREALHALTDHRLLTRCAALRPGPLDTPTAAAKHTLRALARRWLALAEEIATHDQHLTRLTTEAAPTRPPRC